MATQTASEQCYIPANLSSTHNLMRLNRIVWFLSTCAYLENSKKNVPKISGGLISQFKKDHALNLHLSCQQDKPRGALCVSERLRAAITGSFLRCTKCAPLFTNVRRLYGPKPGEILFLVNPENKTLENLRLKIDMRLKVSCD